MQRNKAVAKFWKKNATKVLNITVLAVFSVAMFIGTQPDPGVSAQVARVDTPSFFDYDTTDVDEIAGAELAAAIAQAGKLVIADNVTNLADSLGVQVQLTGADSDPYLDKPSLIATESKTRKDIVNYTVVAGDTVSSIAKDFGVTSDTIRWENDLVGDALGAGKKLKILPISGIRHKVSSNDTPEKLAETYKAKASDIITFNDAELNGLPVGETIIVPNGTKIIVRRTYNYPTSYKLTYGGNGYTFGYCTWHVANRRAQVGKLLPRGLGNAVSWYARAAASGIAVGSTPRAGDVLWHKNTWIAGGYGHVGFVERVNADGSIYVSDMNYGGWNVVSFRTIPVSELSSYLYIH